MTPAASASRDCAADNKKGSLAARAAKLAASGTRGSMAGVSVRAWSRENNRLKRTGGFVPLR